MDALGVCSWQELNFISWAKVRNDIRRRTVAVKDCIWESSTTYSASFRFFFEVAPRRFKCEGGIGDRTFRALEATSAIETI